MINSLADLIAQAESGKNRYAVRYEPKHDPKSQFVVKMFHIVKCSMPTAAMLCSCSWGRYQIMGDELIALNLTMSPMEWCAEEELQDIFFEEFLNAKGLRDFTLTDILTNESKRLEFATKYNGPAHPEVYAQYLLDTYNASK